jgi:hypothetical protein
MESPVNTSNVLPVKFPVSGKMALLPEVMLSIVIFPEPALKISTAEFVRSPVAHEYRIDAFDR